MNEGTETVHAQTLVLIATVIRDHPVPSRPPVGLLRDSTAGEVHM